MVHGGARGGKYPRGDARLKELAAAWSEGDSAMRRGSSLEGVVAAVRYMEDSGAFNAGRGACLTMDGRIQLDAAVMTGRGRRGAGVGSCVCTHNPVLLAKAVMENTDHVLVVGEALEQVARAAGIPCSELAPSARVKARYIEMKKKAEEAHPRNSAFFARMEGNTVGAVATDSDGTPAAAVSTGGVWMKLPGRVGDSALLGAGIYADSGVGAACATGSGEEIIRNALGWNACAMMRDRGAQGAARAAVAMMSARSGPGTAGIITVDVKGRVGAAFNTDAMGMAWFDRSRGRVVVRS
jgi:L-asparaginase / beta-aspartyl-peptidase